MTDAVVDLETMSADVEWTDPVAARVAREHVTPDAGRLADLHEWLAATQGAFPVHEPVLPRCVVFGAVPDAAREIAAGLGVAVRTIEPDASWTVADAFAAGVAAADTEVDSGTDLIAVADADPSSAAAVVVSVLAGTEPVLLLPRGAAAVDSVAWIERAERLRDTRRRVVGLRHSLDELLVALEHPPLAATTGFVLRATVRRTPLVLDGTAALAAALLVYSAQPRAGRWWQWADSSSDPARQKAAAELGLRPVLDLGRERADGVSALLALPLVRAAAQLGLAS